MLIEFGSMLVIFGIAAGVEYLFPREYLPRQG